MKVLINSITNQIRKEFEGEGTGHDWWHIVRVVANAKKISAVEGGNEDVITLAALMHDVGDHKFHKETNAAEILIGNMLEDAGADAQTILLIQKIVSEVSFKGANVKTDATSLEAKIVQDADRLDALGAIGIARAFAFGGNRNRLLYHPAINPNIHTDFETYKNDKGHTINHFYEKLLLLKDRMQTKTGREMALERHRYMEGFLKQFYSEWGE